MPFNFNKAQETVTPAIAINELPQKSGTEALAKVVAGSAQWMAEEFKGKADLESLGNFQGDIQSFEQAIDDLEVSSDLQRLEAVNRLNEIQRNEQTTQEDLVIARQSFAKEIERINLMEQQQGITLESQKRAVVRKWSVIRPDLAPEFQKAIALNKSLLELDRAGPKIDSRFKKFEEQEQLATATGLPVELIQRADRTAKQAAEAKDAYDVKDYAGKAKASDFFQYVNPLVETNRLAMEALYMEGMRRVRAGDAGGVSFAQEGIAKLGNEMAAQLYREQQAYARTHDGIMPDMEQTEKYIKNYTSMYLDDLTTGSALDVARVADMAKEDASDAYLAAWLRDRGGSLFYGLDFTKVPRITRRLGTVVLDSFVKASGEGGLFDRLAKGKFNIVVESARLGDAASAAQLSTLGNLRLDIMARAGEAKLTADQLTLLETMLDGLYNGVLPPPEVAATMGPVLSNLYRGIEADPKATEEERKNAGKGIAGEAWLSFDNVWGRGSILNPKSPGIARIRKETDTEFNTHFNDHVERPLWRYIREVPDPTIVQYNPLAAEDPFSIPKQGMGEYLSQSGFEHAKRKSEETLVSRLNDAWKVRANGRTPSDAHSWARQFHRQFFTKPPEETTAPATPPVTSNEPVVISDEDFQSFLEGKKTPQQILEGQERRGN